MKFIPTFQLLLIYLLLPIVFATAQIRVAIAEFNNESDEFYLDKWEGAVPDLLQSYLSDSREIVVIERRKLQSIFEEKALVQSGLMDSSRVKEIAEFLDAQYIITGTIHLFNGEFQILANILKVASAESRTEKAVSPDAEHLSRMIDLLGNNIVFRLTGEGKYRNRIKLKGFPTIYFLGATIGLAAAAVFANGRYRSNLDKYHENRELEKFDDLYNKANRSRKLTVTLSALTGTAFIGTVYCWIRNLSPNEIYASQTKRLKIIPYLASHKNYGVKIGAQVRF